MKTIKESRFYILLHFLKNYKRYCCAESYYPNSPRKGKVRIFAEQMCFILKSGFPESYYFLYGFDKKEVDFKCMDRYLNFDSFQRKIRACNLIHPDKRYGGFTAWTIMLDKYYFYLFCKTLNVPTIDILLYFRDGRILYDSNKLREKNCDFENTLSDLLDSNSKVFVKLSSGAMGTGAMIIRKEKGQYFVGNENVSLIGLKKLFSCGDFIFQPVLVQHEVLNYLAPFAVNTIRVHTVMKPDGTIMPFGALLRLSRENSVVDNWDKGGVAVGIDMNTGKLHEEGFVKPYYGGIVSCHPDTHVKFGGVEIPYFQEALKYAISLHQNFYRCHSVGWDIAIMECGPVFIEGNTQWEISLVQATHGGLKMDIAYYFESANYKN